MESQTTNRFWKAYNKLSSSVQKATKKIYRRWKENPYDPNLKFKLFKLFNNSSSSLLFNSLKGGKIFL